MVDDEWGALVPGAPVRVVGSPDGPLVGRTFVAKDVFDVAGMPTGAGNPTRRSTSPVAASSAAAVARLLAAGASLVGRARSDELAYGMSGRNELDGTPGNPAAPGHLAGGSSSGSAVAVASGLADIGLGTDTGGSIRVPASHCGLFGLRPTHGRVSTDGLIPLAPSFDTVGWLTAGPELAQAVGATLLDQRATPAVTTPITRLVALDDVIATAHPALSRAVLDLTATLGAFLDHVTLGGTEDLERWREAFRVLQGAEAWAAHGAWLTTDQPALGPAVRARFAAAARITPREVAAASTERERLTQRLGSLLEPGTALVVPAAAGPPLPDDANAAAIDRSRQATVAITCLASLAGLPATAQPVPGLGLPLGLSLIGPPDADEPLLDALARSTP